MTRIAVALFYGAEELDWAGPWEVLSSWAALARGTGSAETVSVVTVADSLDPVTCAKGLRVLPHTTWAELGPIDVLVLPGGMGTTALETDAVWLERLRDLVRDGALVVSVCTGALVVAAAGLLDGRAGTTHWASLDDLAAAGVQVRPDERFVDAGAVITAAGVSAGIDVALHLVARLAGTEMARTVRRYIQYDPAPPV